MQNSFPISVQISAEKDDNPDQPYDLGFNPNQYAGPSMNTPSPNKMASKKTSSPSKNEKRSPSKETKNTPTTNSRLIPGWTSFTDDDSGFVYYVNDVTGESKWAEEMQAVIGVTSGGTLDDSNLLWVEMLDEKQGHVFYYNEITGTTYHTVFLFSFSYHSSLLSCLTTTHPMTMKVNHNGCYRLEEVSNDQLHGKIQQSKD